MRMTTFDQAVEYLQAQGAEVNDWGGDTIGFTGIHLIWDAKTFNYFSEDGYSDNDLIELSSHAALIEIAAEMKEGVNSSKIKDFRLCDEYYKDHRGENKDHWIFTAMNDDSAVYKMSLSVEKDDERTLFITDEKALSEVSPTFRRRFMKEVKLFVFDHYAITF